MDIDSIPLFAMLKGRMGYLNQRQQVIAQNVANASTPGFTPQDLKPFAAKSGKGPTVPGAGGGLAMTPVSLPGGGASLQSQPVAAIPIPGQDAASNSSDYKPVSAPDDETTLDGNQVVLEQQMLKMNETRSDYDIAVGIYQKAMGFLQMAATKPGQS